MKIRGLEFGRFLQVPGQDAAGAQVLAILAVVVVPLSPDIVIDPASWEMVDVGKAAHPIPDLDPHDGYSSFLNGSITTGWLTAGGGVPMISSSGGLGGVMEMSLMVPSCGFFSGGGGG